MHDTSDKSYFKQRITRPNALIPYLIKKKRIFNLKKGVTIWNWSTINNNYNYFTQ